MWAAMSMNGHFPLTHLQQMMLQSKSTISKKKLTSIGSKTNGMSREKILRSEHN
jgi:hypothetical protein